MRNTSGGQDGCLLPERQNHSNNEMGKQNMVCLRGRMLSSLEGEGSSDTCYDIHESRGHLPSKTQSSNTTPKCFMMTFMGGINTYHGGFILINSL